MIRATSDGVPYRVTFTDGRFAATADTTALKGGGDAGFGPHELLEAALATCLTITLEKTARQHGMPLERAGATARLDRGRPGGPVLTYELEMVGALTDEQRRQLTEAAANCPVGKTLTGAISVRPG
jgi:putative redox protein